MLNTIATNKILRDSKMKSKAEIKTFREFNKRIYYIIASNESDCFTTRLTKAQVLQLQKQIDKTIYSECTKFDKDIKDSIEVLSKNCEKCLTVNKKCLVA